MDRSALEAKKEAKRAKARADPNFHLDNILNDALDEFEEQETKDKIAEMATVSEIQDSTMTQVDAEKVKVAEMQKMEKLMDGMNDPRFGSTLTSTLASLSGTTEGIQSVDDLYTTLNQAYDTSAQKSSVLPTDPNDPDAINKADRQIAGTLQMLGGAQKGMEGFEASKLEDAGETMMEDMMAQFEALGEKEDYKEAIDNVMKQLLSRELMYDPCTQVCEKYPEWLAAHKSHLSEKDYNNYGNQYMIFQKVLAVYDVEPDNFPRLMELMFDLQQYGQPPADIIKGLAPGLQFDENGMPIMPNMGAGLMPEMPGGSKMPDLGEATTAMAGGQCTIM
mmetsp:Transcript_18524/g.34602  ORF Transcript_18524/g.34602 Transcript_18524/m.34602 type:complete len:334 (+) Transcript_18524:209-1210(+)|eukprot:CAMPEP_0114420624 /NCGR_PEP_ID=MMETSP0103-20121206/4653_1 /TAXON_ID=37642 ORGANISM="Paraphysomonas imperforata, Strain PA2" /NCGR_SAMPLE_ID=MMETSP0103 /ASSEMBLY_ACC=CAM_ASM_000201 /LENGTH=333 /DNA_ID=CAMNT_0001589109 /DNA_START=137 /DNA_END=1138 /DNA_ORIENTATION=-